MCGTGNFQRALLKCTTNATYVAGKVITTRCQLKTSKRFVVETGGDQISMVWESHLKSPSFLK